VNIVPLPSWTKLAVALVLLAALAGCLTTTPDQDIRRAAHWAAATECASGKGSIKVDRSAGEAVSRSAPFGPMMASVWLRGEMAALPHA
jgi:hypothetical protein